jgi:hypothetical protein
MVEGVGNVLEVKHPGPSPFKKRTEEDAHPGKHSAVRKGYSALLQLSQSKVKNNDSGQSLPVLPKP